ncbi:MAG: PrsW family intramembrane metalloprotease, partial [Kineosporiaceae bacterium]|nr:PrsW family intramembrane metalloprotease [Kineosporiaceae bacterium]
MATAAVFVLRCVVSLSSPTRCSRATGIGLGIASRIRNVAVSSRADPRLVVAVVLHGAWNLSASSGLNGFLTGQRTAAGVGVRALGRDGRGAARRREGLLIERNLTVYFQYRLAQCGR